MAIASSILAALAYLASSFAPMPAAARRVVSAAAWLLHGAALFSLMLAGGVLQIGVTDALSMMAWQTAVLLWCATLVAPVINLKVAVESIAAVFVLLRLLMPPGHASLIVDGAWQMNLHILLSCLSFSVLSLGMLQAAALSAQDRWLHRHGHRVPTTRLPPLETMERLLFAMIAAGFFLLSLTLISGFAFVDDLFAQHLVHKTVLSALAWIILALLLYGRWRHGWRGRTALRWTFSGYAVLVIAYFGSKFVLEVLLQESWG